MGRSGWGGNRSRSLDAPDPILAPSSAGVNPSDSVRSDAATNHPGLDNLPVFDRHPISDHGARNHHAEEEAEPVLLLIDWIVFAWFVWFVVAWRWLLG